MSTSQSRHHAASSRKSSKSKSSTRSPAAVTTAAAARITAPTHRSGASANRSAATATISMNGDEAGLQTELAVLSSAAAPEPSKEASVAKEWDKILLLVVLCTLMDSQSHLLTLLAHSDGSVCALSRHTAGCAVGSVFWIDSFSVTRGWCFINRDWHVWSGRMALLFEAAVVTVCRFVLQSAYDLCSFSLERGEGSDACGVFMHC